MHPLLDATLGWLAAAAVTLLCLGLGRWIARRLGQPDAGAAVTFTAGTWVLSLLWMACAWNSSLTAVEAGVSLGLLVPFAISGWRGRVRKPRSPWTRSRALGALGLLLLAAPFFVQTLVPDTDWDAAMYHRPAAEQFLKYGVLHVDPYRAQHNFPGAIPTLYMGFMALGLTSALTPFNFLSIAILVLAVFELGRGSVGRRGAILAVVLTLSTNILLELGVDQRSDGFLALYFFACLQCALPYCRQPERVGLLPLLGMAMGMATGTKLTGLLTVGVFGGAALVSMLRRRPSRWGPWFAVAMLCLVVPGSFWLVRNAIYLDDPVYPFGQNGLLYHDRNDQLRPFYPDFEPFFARTGKPPATFLTDPGGQKEPGTILHLVDVLLHPGRYTNKALHWLQPLLFVGLLLPLVDRRKKSLLLAGAGGLCFLALGLRAHLVRYALPAYPMLALAAAAVLTHPRWGRRGRRRAFVLAMSIGVGYCTHNVVHEWIKTYRLAPLDYLLHRQGPHAWKVLHGYNGDVTTGIIAFRVNQLVRAGQIDPRDTILMVGESKVELFTNRAIPDVSAELYPFLAAFVRAGGDDQRLRRDLQDSGIRYILVNKKHIGWAVRGLELNSRLQNREYLRFGAYHALRFGRMHGTWVIKDKNFDLFRID